MASCDGIFIPKQGAPPNWVLTPENLYSGRLLDEFSSIYAAAELREQINSGPSNPYYSDRVNAWRSKLSSLKLPPTQNTTIIDLGLTPDLCLGGRPPDPGIPTLTPEALGNGSVGNAVAELVKQKLFDQYCICKPRDYEKETCPCQRYRVTWSYKFPGGSTVTTTSNLIGKLGAAETREVPNDPGVSGFGMNSKIGCTDAGLPSPEFIYLISGASEAINSAELKIVNVVKTPGWEVIDCSPADPPPQPEPYKPGITGVVGFPLPVPLPVPVPIPVPIPIPFAPFTISFGNPTFPKDCPPEEPCDYMYWQLKSGSVSELYSGIPNLLGITVAGSVDTTAFKIEFNILQALADNTLRNWKRSAQPPQISTTFVNAFNCYLMVDGVALNDGIEMNVPEMIINIPFEFRARSVSLKIMPKGATTPLKISDAGYRWEQKKFAPMP